MRTTEQLRQLQASALRQIHERQHGAATDSMEQYARSGCCVNLRPYRRQPGSVLMLRRCSDPDVSAALVPHGD